MYDPVAKTWSAADNSVMMLGEVTSVGTGGTTAYRATFRGVHLNQTYRVRWVFYYTTNTMPPPAPSLILITGPSVTM